MTAETKPARVDGYASRHKETGEWCSELDQRDYTGQCFANWEVRPVILADAEKDVVLPRALVDSMRDLICAYSFEHEDFSPYVLYLLDAALGGGEE